MLHFSLLQDKNHTSFKTKSILEHLKIASQCQKNIKKARFSDYHLLFTIYNYEMQHSFSLMPLSVDCVVYVYVLNVILCLDGKKCKSLVLSFSNKMYI